MSVSVRIPTILRTYTGGESEVNADGATLAEVLDVLDASYPGIRARILDDQGAIRRFVNVYVGNDDVRFLEALDTSTADGRPGLGDPGGRRRLLASLRQAGRQRAHAVVPAGGDAVGPLLHGSPRARGTDVAIFLAFSAGVSIPAR